MKQSFNKQIQAVFPDTPLEGAWYSSNSTMPLTHSTAALSAKNSMSTETRAIWLNLADIILLIPWTQVSNMSNRTQEFC